MTWQRARGRSRDELSFLIADGAPRLGQTWVAYHPTGRASRLVRLVHL